MRVEGESSLRILVNGVPLHLIVGAPRPDGSTPCHLLSEGSPHDAYFISRDLTGRILEFQIVGHDRPRTGPTQMSIERVTQATWRTGLSEGVRRRLEVLERLADEVPAAPEDLRKAILTTRARLAALKSADPQLQPLLAALAPGGPEP